MGYTDDLQRSPDVVDHNGDLLPPHRRWRVSGGLRAFETSEGLVLEGASAGSLAPSLRAAFGQGSVPGVNATPGWVVLGAFVFDFSAADLRLDALAFVSDGALTARVRLFDLTDGDELVESVLSTSATTEARLTTDNLAELLEADHVYQLQAECTGGSDTGDFAVIRYMMLRGQ